MGSFVQIDEFVIAFAKGMGTSSVRVGLGFDGEFKKHDEWALWTTRYNRERPSAFDRAGSGPANAGDVVENGFGNHTVEPTACYGLLILRIHWGKSRKSRITYYRCKDHLSFLVYRKSGVKIYVKYVMPNLPQFAPEFFFVCVRDT